jgi:hypothetical protein
MFCLFFFCFADRYSRRKCFAFTPNGMKIDALSYNVTGARYGYNGTHEQDKEINADGNYLDFGNFGYDTRVARRFNLDPIDQIFISNYEGFGNNPIYFSDPSGYSPSDPDNGSGSNTTTTETNNNKGVVVVYANREPTAQEGLSVYSQSSNSNNNVSNSEQNHFLNNHRVHIFHR